MCLGVALHWWPHERVNHHMWTDWPLPGPGCSNVNLHSWLHNECLGSFVLSWQHHQRHHHTNTERYHSACIFKCIISGPASHVGISECIYMLDGVEWMQPVEDNPYDPLLLEVRYQKHTQCKHIIVHILRDVLAIWERWDIIVHIERDILAIEISSCKEGSGWTHDEDNSYDLSHNYWRSGSPRMCTSVPYSKPHANKYENTIATHQASLSCT